MVSVTIQLDETTAEAIRQLAASQNRSESELARDAVLSYLQHHTRPLPKGLGKYHSGHRATSAQARDLLKEAVEKGQWP